MEQPTLYVPKRILITGGCGFIGSHVVVRLVKAGYEVVNLDCLDYCASLRNLQDISSFPNYKFIRGNILSADLIQYILQENNIDTIFHFAAQSHVDNSFGNSLEFTRVNVLGTHTLLEAARVCNIKRFIHVSTDEVYGESAGGDMCCEEEKILQPTNPYAASKAAAEFIVNGYARSFGMDIIITRGNNVYGPRQFPEKIIPKFINRICKNLPCCIHGDGSNKRNYVFVEDAAEAYQLVLEKGKAGTTYNVGSSFECSNFEVATTLLQALGKENVNEWIVLVPDRKINDKRYNIDSTKLRELGWEPKTSWEEGIRKTIHWYLHNPNHWGNIDAALVPHPLANTSFNV